MILVRVVTLQSRGARGKFCCGLGVRAVRAGSIGRDGRGLGESADPPQGDAGGLGPRPLHEEISASWFQADRPDPQALRTSWPSRQTSIRCGWSMVTEGLLSKDYGGERGGIEKSRGNEGRRSTLRNGRPDPTMFPGFPRFLWRRSHSLPSPGSSPWRSWPCPRPVFPKPRQHGFAPKAPDLPRR
jgi:hypothetical protein